MEYSVNSLVFTREPRSQKSALSSPICGTIISQLLAGMLRYGKPYFPQCNGGCRKAAHIVGGDLE